MIRQPFGRGKTRRHFANRLSSAATIRIEDLMKALLLTLGMTAMVATAFAQGYVNFNPVSFSVSTNTDLSPQWGGGGSGSPSGPTMTNPNSYYYALLVTAQTDWQTSPTDPAVWDGSWVDSRILASNSPVAGTVIGPPPPTSVGGVINNLGQAWNGNNTPTGGPAAVTNGIVLVGWSANLGTTWAGVSNILAAMSVGNYYPLYTQMAQSGFSPVFFGESAFGYIAPNAFSGAGTAVFGTGPIVNGLPIDTSAGMTLYMLPIPEPGTMALTGLSGLALLFLRRHKQ